MTLENIMAELQAKGSEQTKKIFLKHGMKEPIFGVLVKDLKEIHKKVKVNYQLSKELYATGNADAMYLAGLIADDSKMTLTDLTKWVSAAESSNINFYTVPWVAAEGKYGFDVAIKWINDKRQHVVSAGWATLANLVALKPDSELDILALKKLLQRGLKEMEKFENKAAAAINSFIVSAACYVIPLSDYALELLNNSLAAKSIASEMCSRSIEAINKANKKGTPGKKKKTVKC